LIVLVPLILKSLYMSANIRLTE